MKNKIFCIAVFLLSIAAYGFAVTHEDNLTTPLELMGFIRQYHMVEIVPVEENEAGNQGFGMPFDIMGSDVSYKADRTTGRQIATWTIASTYAPISIRISAEPLQSIANPSVVIDYYLSFRYNYANFDDYGKSTGSTFGYIIVSSTEDSVSQELTNQSSGGQIYPVISRSQDVRFMLSEKYTDSDKAQWPVGYYTSTIVIEVIGS